MLCSDSSIGIYQKCRNPLNLQTKISNWLKITCNRSLLSLQINHLDDLYTVWIPKNAELLWYRHRTTRSLDVDGSLLLNLSVTSDVDH